MSTQEDMVEQALDIARGFTRAGVPVFLAHPNKAGKYIPPKRWQYTEPDPAVLDEWEPGLALGMVTGMGVDGIDIDPRNGGSEESLRRAGIYPEMVIARVHTPSGGTHLLIPSVGVRSRDSILQGVDLKAGVNGEGAGFLFIAPTVRPHGGYEWVSEPDYSILDTEVGGPLADYVGDLRTRVHGAQGYNPDSVAYQDLEPELQQAADAHVEATIQDWVVRLAEAAVWPEGERDSVGRGWEALARDAAWSIASLSAASWSSLDEASAEKAYERILPEAMAQDEVCSGKWYRGLVQKAGARSANLPPWWVQDLMSSTGTLRHIRDVALSRVMVPEGVLAMVLGRCLFEAPIESVLPGITGSDAALNIGVVLAGHPGSGKSSTIDLSRSILGMVGRDQQSYESGLGSGEGFIELFLQPGVKETKDGENKPDYNNLVVSEDPRAIVLVDEIQTLESFSSRRGSTSSTMLRTALTGGALSTANTRAGGRNRHVPSRSYRALVVMGVQPRHSEALLSEQEVAGGTPQRFLWAPMYDETMNIQDVNEALARVDKVSLDWVMPAGVGRQIRYPEQVKQQILGASIRQVSKDPIGVGTSYYSEGHLLLLQLKIAFALAILHSETEISMLWWEMAGVLVAGSLDVQQVCRDVVHRSLSKSAAARELSKMSAVATATGSRLTKAAEALSVRVRSASNGEWVPWWRVRPSIAARHGLDASDIAEELRTVDPEIDIETKERDGAAPITRFRHGA